MTNTELIDSIRKAVYKHKSAEAELRFIIGKDEDDKLSDYLDSKHPELSITNNKLIKWSDNEAINGEQTEFYNWTSDLGMEVLKGFRYFLKTSEEVTIGKYNYNISDLIKYLEENYPAGPDYEDSFTSYDIDMEAEWIRYEYFNGGRAAPASWDEDIIRFNSIQAKSMLKAYREEMGIE